ncbi:MAG TPA: heat-inducible transcriptional repressor HrcA [Steroidobacteraceae bacterium]|nr:heat-inducible transcriptional repressor HrcA [Steroidobacteraceae bacterium]
MSDDPNPAEVLNERAQHLLRVLVQSYIREGQPVGSRNLSRDSGLSLSSATIRNVMADLEELGFVTSPHTSAGRVPTDRGYRFFVDSLLRAELPQADSVELDDLREQLKAAPEGPKELVASASQLLSRITHLAGLVTMPLAPAATLTQIEFVNLTENRVLVILVFNDREVQNRIVQLDRRYGPEELRRAANFLNEHCRSRSLAELHAELLRQLKETHASINQVMLDAISIAQQVCGTGAKQEGIEYVIAGETNLMGLAELSSVEKLKRLFEAFTEKRDILHLLDQSLRADGVQIFIGHESGYQILDDVSVITAPYSTGEGVAGVLGVIGPTRMAYERVIPIVDVTAKLLGSALNSRR